MEKNMMEEIFMEMLEKTAEAGEVSQKLADDLLAEGIIIKDEENFDPLADDDEEDSRWDCDYLAFSSRTKRGRRHDGKKNAKKHNKRIYEPEEIARYAWSDKAWLNEYRGITPVFHGKDEPVAFIRKSSHYARAKKFWKKVDHRKLRHQKLSDWEQIEIANSGEEFSMNYSWAILKRLAEAEENPHLMTPISQLDEFGLGEYKMWLNVQIKVREYNLLGISFKIQDLEKERDKIIRELYELYG